MPPLFLVHQSLLPGVKQLPGHPHPVPGDAATLLGAPESAALCLAPLNIARREHLLLHIVFIFILVSLLDPALEISPMLGYFTLPVIEQSIKNPNLDIILLIEA